MVSEKKIKPLKCLNKRTIKEFTKFMMFRAEISTMKVAASNCKYKFTRLLNRFY